MRILTKKIIIAVLVFAFLSIVPQKIPSTGILYCYWYAVMENKDRYCYADDENILRAECEWWHEDKPWGNWGVDSNIEPRCDGFQFEGWRWIDGKNQWNGCTDEYPPPDTYYYNDKWKNGGWTQQKSEWERTYAVVREVWVPTSLEYG